jgi:uncharacterized protein YndB with AHSA1/START domain
MTIAPIVRSVEVKASPARAFELFTGGIGAWWPNNMTIGPKPPVHIALEPKVGGAIFERTDDGVVTLWGDVLAWEPPGRLVFAWRINNRWAYDPNLLTEVEVTFLATGEGRTKVTLTHTKLENIGTDAAAHAETLGNGWPGFLASFGKYADENA